MKIKATMLILTIMLLTVKAQVVEKENRDTVTKTMAD